LRETPRIVPATGALLDEILDATYPIWGEGLNRAAYARLNVAQLKTPWGGANLRRVALVSASSGLLSTAKRYTLSARLDGRPVRVLGIGAVFTPVRLRRHGFAAELIEQILDEGRRESFDLALLFSAIGPDYYRRFGFEPVPVEQASLTVRYKPGAPAILMRAGGDRDVPLLAEMHAARASASTWRFALERDADFIRFSITRKRLLAGLGPPGLRHLEYFVVEEGGRPVAYAVLLRSDGDRVLTECGDRDPTGARVGALLQVVFARTPNERQPAVRAWLPPGFRPPQVDVVPGDRAAVMMMLRPLQPGGGVTPPLTAADVAYWLGDVV
jgi:GNAT superfamily N-acetyltransferase